MIIYKCILSNIFSIFGYINIVLWFNLISDKAKKTLIYVNGSIDGVKEVFWSSLVLDFLFKNILILLCVFVLIILEVAIRKYIIKKDIFIFPYMKIPQKLFFLYFIVFWLGLMFLIPPLWINFI